jgi:hypothetical protein
MVFVQAQAQAQAYIHTYYHLCRRLYDIWKTSGRWLENTYSHIDYNHQLEGTFSFIIDNKN